MYKLKSLEITNFKSYKSFHKIPFDDHFTCIIGPNGSGKSNILDAIVFVMTNTPYNIKNATVKLILKQDNEEISFTRFINMNSKNSYFINNKKTVFKEYITNFIIYQSHTDYPLHLIIEQASGSIKYKDEYNKLKNKYNELLIKLKIETESRRQYLNILRENKKYEEEYNKYLGQTKRKKEIEDALFNNKIRKLVHRYTSLRDKFVVQTNKMLINKKKLLNENIKNQNFLIDQKQDLISKIERDLAYKPNPLIPNFDSLETEYFRLLNNEECCKIEVEDEVSKIMILEKDSLISKYKDNILNYNNLEEEYKKYNEELNICNNEILIDKNIKSKNIKLYNIKNKIKDLEGVIGFIPDLIRCHNEKYDMAIRSILMSYEFTCVVKDKETAFRCIKLCKDLKLGRISCIVKDNVKKTTITSGYKDLVSPLLVVNYPGDISHIVEYIFGNILISNKEYSMNIKENMFNICTIDGVIIKNKGRLINFHKCLPSSSSLDKRLDLLNTLKSLKQKLDSFSKIELIKLKINKLQEEIDTRKIKKITVLVPETKVFGDLFKKYGYKNYSDYVSRNSKYYEEENQIKNKVLEEKKNKISKKLEEEVKRLRELEEEYNKIKVEEDINEETGNEKEEIEEEIRDLYFIERNEVIEIQEILEKYKSMTNNENNDNINNLWSELEDINKALKNTTLIKNTTTLDYNSEIYDKLKKETLETKSTLNSVKNKRTELFTSYLTKMNEIILGLYSEISGGSCNLVADNPEEPFESVKYYVMVPNKKYQDYNLLSGGEQMISRVVLMYALTKMSNKEFILLDEVDSNLDNYNVQRLVEFIKREKIQVVMVSLKVGVYKESNKMIGVYKKSGVSKTLHYAM
ncbi:structural maintenance of chromosomes protein [Vairimorpha necatrix]|uniref:Structural maintenance of chromosomes protein n=1 Tax=Vairimorpha necatrix TaxID=6039 RepID=A0AAX4JBG2_9MICR